MIILFIAAVFGSVGGYFLTDMLMGSIWTYYTDITPTSFILATIIMFLISSLTVGYKVIAAALANPVDTLRNE